MRCDHSEGCPRHHCSYSFHSSIYSSHRTYAFKRVDLPIEEHEDAGIRPYRHRCRAAVLPSAAQSLVPWLLFVVFVVSYMLKDRIKDLLRYYFAHRLGDKYFDKKATVTIGNNRVGVIKEGFDFISKSRTPSEVMNMRDKASTVEDESRIFEEKVMLYRKHVIIDDRAMAKNADYPMRGINEIMRLHLTRFTQKMDNAEVPIDTVDADGKLTTYSIQKIYHVHVIFQLQHDGEVEYHQFRISMTRNGVQAIDEI